jgi:hypothetical protein
VPADFALAVSGVMKFVLRPAVWLLASVAMLAVACDRDSPSNDGGQSGGDSPIILRGGERLAWDQPALPGTNPSSYLYIMFIDDAATTLTNVTCTSASSAFTCSSVLPPMSPGRHSLTLVASQGSATSAPSRSLDVMVSVSVSAIMLPQVAAVRDQKALAQPRCTGTGPCYRSSELLRSGGLISSPVSALNERLLFVVEGRQIQSLLPGSTLPTVLLNVESPAARILSIAVPSSPGDGSLVWVTSAETRVDDTRILTITRYRLVEDTLGEAAVVVSMRIPNVEPRVVIGDDSHIYIAMPSTGTTHASLWRLMADGTTPRSQLSPELSPVPSDLKAIALAPEDQLWVSSVDDTGRGQLGHIGSIAAGARFQSVAPAVDDRQTSSLDITSFAFTRPVAGRPESSVLAVASGALYRASADGFTLGSMQRVPMPVSRGTPIEVAADDGGVYVVTAVLNDGPVVYTLLRLSP